MTRAQTAWLYGLVSGVVGGGASAVVSALGLAGAHAIGVNVTPLDLKQSCGVFISGAFISAALFLKQSPLPPMESDTSWFRRWRSEHKDKADAPPEPPAGTN